MFINYGTKATNLRNGQIINTDCPNCEKVTTMKYSIFGKYGHFYWIPFFPMKKITVAECNLCYKTFEYVDLYESIRIKIQREIEKNPVRFPIWMFSGIFIIIGLICFGVYKSNANKTKYLDYIKNPKKGDVYYLQVSEENYSTIKVFDLTRTEVFLTHNDFEINKLSQLNTIDEDKNYNRYKDTVDILNLKNYLTDENLIEVIRNHE